MLDEAAHIDPNLFYKTIVPILQLKNTSLLALSSPTGSENYYSQLLNLRDQYGREWFKVISKNLVCKECQKGDRAKQLACDHVPKTESWLSNDRLDRLKVLYEHAEGTALQELAGMVVNEYQPAFNTKDIERCFNGPRVLTKSPPGIIFITADPSGGGPSHLALASAYFDQALNLVVRIFFLFLFLESGRKRPLLAAHATAFWSPPRHRASTVACRPKGPKNKVLMVDHLQPIFSGLLVDAVANVLL